MKPSRNSVIAVIAWTIIFIIGAFIDAQAQSPQYMFDYGGYPYWVRSECRELNRTRGRVNYTHALECAVNTMEAIRLRELREAQIENLKANTELTEQLTHEIKTGSRKKRGK